MHYSICKLRSRYISILHFRDVEQWWLSGSQYVVNFSMLVSSDNSSCQASSVINSYFLLQKWVHSKVPWHKRGHLYLHFSLNSIRTDLATLQRLFHKAFVSSPPGGPWLKHQVTMPQIKNGEYTWISIKEANYILYFYYEARRLLCCLLLVPFTLASKNRGFSKIANLRWKLLSNFLKTTKKPRQKNPPREWGFLKLRVKLREVCKCKC